MNLRKEFFACLALRHTPGLGPKSWSAVLNSYSSAYEALKDWKRWSEQGLAPEKVAEAAGSELWRKKAEAEYREAIRHGFGILPWTHSSFPEGLKEIPDPPPYLYYYGNPELLKNPSIAIVGSRKCSELGLSVAKNMSRDLASSGITIVSGFARGIDSCVHEQALEEIGSTVAVLGTGLDVVDYPSGSIALREKIIEHGLMISEFSPSTPPYSGNFPFRNRIISALSVGVLVAEASVKSGSLITARIAGEQGREVMAVPGPVGDARFSGCLKLIKEGAALVESVEDVLCTIGYALNSDLKNKVLQSGFDNIAPEVKPLLNRKKMQTCDVEKEMPESSSSVDKEKQIDFESLGEDQAAFVNVLMSGEKLHIDELSRILEWDGGKSGVVALELEVKGIIVRYPGMYYSI